MNRKLGSFSIVAIVSTLLFGSVLSIDAQRRNEREVRDALRSLSSKLDDFEANLRFQMQSGSSNVGDIGAVQDDIRDMRDAVSRFSDNLDRRRENADDVDQIVNVARILDDFLLDNPQNRRVTDTWVDIKRQLDRLASNYGRTNAWGNSGSSANPQPSYTPVPVYTNPASGGAVYVGLSGTYNIDPQRSERVDDIVSDAGVSGGNVQDLKEKLDAPNQIAIDVRGTQVTLATSKASPVTFTADGRDKTERDPQGRNIRMRATLAGDKLIVSSIGGETDYTITFTWSNNGQVLKVSRRITTDYLNQTVFAESVYNKTDAVARLGIPVGGASSGTYDTTANNGSGGNNNSTYDSNGGYSDNDRGNATISNGGTGNNNAGYGTNNRTYNPGRPSPAYAKPGNYTVPGGAMVTGILDNEINTRYSQNGDRFRMTVQSPNEFRGALVQGYIANIERSGKMTGTAAVTLIFEKITLRNGQTYDFAGTLRTAADAAGKSARVDNEGTVRGENQTVNTAKRGGISAGIGALIGAIAGGGKGAAIGAIIGGGAGAGSVALQDRKDVQLSVGSTLTVQAAAPSNVR